MGLEVFAIIKNYTDDCTYSSEDFETLELYSSEEKAKLRVTELELDILESESSYSSPRETVFLKKIEVY